MTIEDKEIKEIISILEEQKGFIDNHNGKFTEFGKGFYDPKGYGIVESRKGKYVFPIYECNFTINSMYVKDGKVHLSCCSVGSANCGFDFDNFNRIHNGERYSTYEQVHFTKQLVK